jgi:YVTN family beta-propeller protein
MSRKSALFATVAVLGLLVTLSVAASSQVAATGQSLAGYRLIRTIPVGGDGSWDYMAVDSTARRLYVSRATRVTVMDTDTYAVVGEVPDTQGVHGVALAQEFGRGFTSNGATDTVSIFDLKTLEVLGTAKTGKRPDAIVYDSASRRVFAFNGDAGTSTVIDAVTGSVVATVELGGDPEFAVADGEGHVYNNLEDQSMVLQIDSRSLKVLNRWPLAPCESPSGMAIDKEHRRLFVGCHNEMMAIMDADTGGVVATLPIGQGVDANAFDPGTQLAFSSNGDGTLTVIHEDSRDRYAVVATVRTREGARTMALDPQTHDIFLAAADLGPVKKGEHWPSAIPGSFVILVVAMR